MGGTQVRFVYRLPVGALLLTAYLAAVPSRLPAIPGKALAWAVAGSARSAR